MYSVLDRTNRAIITIFSECFFPLFSYFPSTHIGSAQKSYPPSAADSPFDSPCLPFWKTNARLQWNPNRIYFASRILILSINPWVIECIVAGTHGQHKMKCISWKTRPSTQRQTHHNKHVAARKVTIVLLSIRFRWCCGSAERRKKIDFHTTNRYESALRTVGAASPNALLGVSFASTNIYNSFTCVRVSECKFVRTCL